MQKSNEISSSYIDKSSMIRSTKIDGIERTTTPLSFAFSPGPYDVICARGKEAKNHPGNIHYRSVIDKAVEKYEKASSRMEKTIVVSNIVETVRSNSCGGGGFVKYEDGHWYEVGDSMAREKVGQSLREKLHVKYKSSTKAKRRKKKEMNEKIDSSYYLLESVININDFVENMMNRLAITIEQAEEHMSEMEVEFAMTQANSEILASLKADTCIQRILKEQETSSLHSLLPARDQEEVE
jgi:hypothetical protein